MLSKTFKNQITLLFALLFFGATTITAAPGDLDPTFGNGGIAIANIPGVIFYTAGAMAIQPDGKIVVVGEGTTGGYWDSAVVRFNPDGSLDSSFGGTGAVVTRLSDNYDGARGVAIQPDGKIVVVSAVFDGSWGKFGVVRYNPNGSLDTSFNGSGIVLTSVGSAGNSNSVAIQTDGKIVVAGSNGTDSFAIVRYNPNGSLDTTFNGSGKVLTPVGHAASVAIQADGKIIATGGAGFGSGFTLVRYNADGSLDTSFNGTGIVSAGNSGFPSDLAVQTDGKIVVVGYATDFNSVRFNPDGSLDTSFGGTGKILIPFYPGSVAIQPNGKIVVGGITYIDYIDNDSVFAVGRLNPNGSVDTSFHGGGIVTTSVGVGASVYDEVGLVAIQADGKIVVAGDSGPDEFKSFVVVRYQGDAPAACPNPIDRAEFFVRQHYLDFLNREPDPLAAQWVNLINSCLPGDSNCDRIHVSEAFFKSPEFQERGYFAYRFYSVSFGRKPDFAEFMPDLARVSGFLTPSELEAAKVSFINDFMARPAFGSRYNGLNNTQYVDALLSTAGVTLSNRQALIDALNSSSLSRGQVLRQIVEAAEVYQRFYNQAFVVMQYFGYLRRDPDILYLNWIATLDANPSDSRHMIAGFVNSIEYRQRFGLP